MAVNRDKPDKWKDDVAKSVDFYNDWFMRFAPKAFRETRIEETKHVTKALKDTANLVNISPDVLKKSPSVLQMLRMCTCPPIARDRLIGLSGTSSNLVKCMEIDNVIPQRMPSITLDEELLKIANTIQKMADPDIFVWLQRKKPGTEKEVQRAATIVADRLCGAVADPIIRNAQEKRQLALARKWLEARGYSLLKNGSRAKLDNFPKGTFAFRFNIPGYLRDEHKVNIPIDIIVKPQKSADREFPILFEAKSAGDFTNVNKRRKEEATKMSQLRRTYGKKVSFNLLLCGYFDSGYLGYEAAEGIDWVWEHRIDDLSLFGI